LPDLFKGTEGGQNLDEISTAFEAQGMVFSDLGVCALFLVDFGEN
jgi:hypothetical protein